MPAAETIRRLVARFEEHREAHRLSRYNEAQLRREFLDPLLEALGWDIFNKQDISGPQDKERLGREIESTDRAIDRLVYELYGLNEEEIKIVEGA